MPLYTVDFAADPRGFFRRWRAEFGALVPVELAPGVAATLVVGHAEALKILHSPEVFSPDPDGWQRRTGAGCPVGAMLGSGPTPARTSGTDHARFRGAHTAVLGRVDQHAVQAGVERTAVDLINQFWARGEAELRTQFAAPLALAAVNALVGVPEELVDEVARAVPALAEAGDAGVAGRRTLESVLQEVVVWKTTAPSADVVSWLLAHDSGLLEAEVVAQLVLIYEMAVESTIGLITNAVASMLTDDRMDAALGGSLSTRDVLDAVLFDNPPLAQWCVRYPQVPQLIGNVWLPAHQPVVIGLGACHRDPAVAQGDRRGNRSHLGFGAGTHACPASGLAILIATAALDQLMDAVPDMRLAADLVWRASPFHRCVTALPVRFAPPRPLPY
ncbi:cytochrome P450 [Nocardia speluncae]|uniref:Cytochrome P450 n=1 Tax=Nocardia speluncae TaxID=419477 RepID=A0A846XEW2_9NOCA|nr:cytochrome P450 [Nocardia speluncae]NKY33915.1 cytochrome P450 [Nocardia speluncae]